MQEPVSRAKPDSVDVSVVIVNWNTRDLLNQALESLYRETHDVKFETIVVDNGSDDGSAELVKRIWKQVKLIPLQVNSGFGVANNIGFQVSLGRYVLVLNSDTIVLPSTLYGMAHFLDDHPETGCVGCRHLNVDGTLQGSMDSFPSLLKDFLCYSDLYRLRALLPFLRWRYPWWSDHSQIRKVDWVNGSCMMVRREVIEEIGGFDDGCFMYAEEIDWCYRMNKAGWAVVFTPEAEIIHIGGQSSNRIVDKRITLLYKGQYRFYQRNYQRWKYVALRLIVTIVAIPRIVILVFLCLRSYMKTDTRVIGLEILTQEPKATDPTMMLRAWWNILWLPWRA